MKTVRTITRYSVNEWLGVPEDWPIVENTGYVLIVKPNARDIRTGRMNDPKGCALCKAICRLYDVPAAAIGSRVAYIPQYDQKGRPFIGRFRADSATIKAIERFDQTGEMPEGGFRFRPVPKTRTLQYMRAYKKNHYPSRKRRPKTTFKPRRERQIPGQFSSKSD